MPLVSDETYRDGYGYATEFFKGTQEELAKHLNQLARQCDIVTVQWLAGHASVSNYFICLKRV